MVNNRISLSILVSGEIVLVLYQIIYQVDLMCYSSSRILSHLNGPVVPLSDMQPYGLMLMLYSILGNRLFGQIHPALKIEMFLQRRYC